ncbi:MAG: hypothetical protein F6K39_16385, partial [Okeania sp. SIO3B3]|nr:hypothetical protein [Okeania sp. SIO3B3]
INIPKKVDENIWIVDGGEKAAGAEGRRQKGKKSLKGEGFFITDYPDMILEPKISFFIS